MFRASIKRYFEIKDFKIKKKWAGPILLNFDFLHPCARDDSATFERSALLGCEIIYNLSIQDVLKQQ